MEICAADLTQEACNTKVVESWHKCPACKKSFEAKELRAVVLRDTENKSETFK